MELTDVFFVSIYVMVPSLIIALCKLSGIRLSRLGVPSVFVGLYLIFAYIGLLPLYFYWSPQRFHLGVVDRGLILEMFVYSSCTLLLVAVGFIFASKILNWKLRNNLPVTISLSKSEVILANTTLCACVFVLLLYIRQLSAIPLFGILSDDTELALARSMATNDFSGKYHWYKLFMKELLLFVTYILFSNACVKKNFKNRLYASTAIGFSLMSTLITLEKAPVIFLFLGLFITYMLSHGMPLRLKNVAFICLAILGMLWPMYIFFMGVGHLSTLQLAGGIFDRLCLGSLAPAYFYIKLFPDIHPYLFGASLPNPQGILPWDQYNLSVEIMDYIKPSLSQVGIVGSAPTAFWGEAYANFGRLGVISISFVVGVGLYKVQHSLNRLPNYPVSIALIAWLSLHLGKMSITGFSGYLIDVYMVGVLILAFLFLLLRGTMRGNHRNLNSRMT